MRNAQVLQYIEGQTLKKVIGGQPLAIDSVLSVTQQVAEVLKKSAIGQLPIGNARRGAGVVELAALEML